MMFLELADEIEAVTSLAALIVDVGARALDLDGAALETGEVGAALLGLFGVEQCTTDGGICAILDHVGVGTRTGGRRGGCFGLPGSLMGCFGTKAGGMGEGGAVRF